MPSGSLVAGYSVRTLPNLKLKKEIILWERNGLRHGEFTLPDQDLSVQGIEYS